MFLHHLDEDNACMRASMGGPVLLNQIIVFRALEAQHVIYTSLCQAIFSKQLGALWRRRFIIHEDAVVTIRRNMTKNMR